MDRTIEIQKDFRPLLSGKAPKDFREIVFPVLASPKLDGIRALRIGGRLVSRTLKDIPNDYVRDWCCSNLCDGLDGELLLPGMTEPFEEVSSAIMSKDGKPDFVFAVFDKIETQPFSLRLQSLPDWVPHTEHCRVVPHDMIYHAQELEEYCASCIELGFEGTMIRSPGGRYKFGRSTEKEGILLKIKHFDDDEAEVIGKVEEMHNTNEQTLNEIGLSKRSSAKAGKVGKGRLGALVCRFADGTEFECGAGFTEQQRIDLWAADLSGVQVTVRHQPPPGGRPAGKKPRIPVFKGIRRDL
jgi:DNA ligase-1